MPDGLVTLCLGGDVMTGRGVDQILPHPGDPELWEEYVRDARTYVALAESVNGPVPRPVDPTWPWGDALAVLDRERPDYRILNLETSITRSDDRAPGKAVHYRMSPENLACLTVARPHVCTLANNHVCDFGLPGLRDTRDALAGAGVATTGAGPDDATAARPAVLTSGAAAGRAVVAASGTTSSGIPSDWAAGTDRPGVDLLPDLSTATADRLATRVERERRPGDVTVVSLHWGSNWGYRVPTAHVDFAHRLIDRGVHVVHGHSSHHPRPIEVYRGRLILYGCGDLIDDYEGIRGDGDIRSDADYRDDLRLLYLASVDPDTGRLADLRMVPMRARRMRLDHASAADTGFLREVLDRIGAPFGTRTELVPDGMLAIRTGR